MKANNRILYINGSNIDAWLSATGYLYPLTEKQLNLFNNVYREFDFKLKDKHIDVEAILSNKIGFSGNQSIKHFDDREIISDIQQYKMVARKGEVDIPQEIIDKMRQHHKKDEE